MPIVSSFAGASTRAYGLGAGGVAIGDFESIATVTVGTAAATVEFTSIPATYTHLQIRASLQSTRATYPIDKLFWRFNSDTGSNYSSHQFISNHETVESLTDNTTSISGSDLISTSAYESGLVFGSLILDILDYTNTNKFKTCLAIAGTDSNGLVSGFRGRQGFVSGNYRSSSAITSVTFRAESGNIDVDSKFALYGVKA